MTTKVYLSIEEHSPGEYKPSCVFLTQEEAEEAVNKFPDEKFVVELDVVYEAKS